MGNFRAGSHSQVYWLQIPPVQWGQHHFLLCRVTVSIENVACFNTLINKKKKNQKKVACQLGYDVANRVFTIQQMLDKNGPDLFFKK